MPYSFQIFYKHDHPIVWLIRKKLFEARCIKIKIPLRPTRKARLMLKGIKVQNLNRLFYFFPESSAVNLFHLIADTVVDHSLEP